MTPAPDSRPGLSPAEALSYAQVLRAEAENGALRKTERTRARLLASLADQLMAGVERGDLTVAETTGGAGLAHGTFYRYFADIRSATEALVEEFALFVRARLAGAREGQTGSRERVRGATLLYVRLFRANAGLMRCLIGLGRESEAFGRSYQRLNRDWNERMAAAIARRRAATGGETARPPAAFLPVAYALGGMVDEFLTQLYLRRDPALAALRDDEAAVAALLTELWCLGADGAPVARVSAP